MAVFYLAGLSSLRNRPLPHDMVILDSEIRPVPRGMERLQEAAKHRFTRAIVPAANVPKPVDMIDVLPVKRLADALALV